MYLARIGRGTSLHYEIRSSQRVGEIFQHSTVFDLGRRVQDHFEIIDDHIVIFSAQLSRAVEKAAGRDADNALEKLLWDFLPPETRRRLDPLRKRSYRYGGSLSEEERSEISHQVHLFDRRRLYYIRYGAVDQSRLSRLHEKCCRPLLGQSRDEREYYFAAEEQHLEPGLYRQYIHAIFQLHNHFSQSYGSWLPEALPFSELADAFLDALCRLNRDATFRQEDLPTHGTHGMAAGRSLHHHLQRYVIMFFDYAPQIPGFDQAFARRFMADHRRFRWPEPKSQAQREQVVELFGVDYDQLRKMSADALTRLYRRLAKVHHPDMGGRQHDFILLTEIYRSLMSS